MHAHLSTVTKTPGKCTGKQFCMFTRTRLLSALLCHTSVFPSRVCTVSHHRTRRHCPPSCAYVLSHNPDSSPSNAFVWPPPRFSWVTAVEGRPAPACWSQFALTFVLSSGAWWRHIQSFARQIIAPVVEKCLMTRLKTTRALKLNLLKGFYGLFSGSYFALLSSSIRPSSQYRPSGRGVITYDIVTSGHKWPVTLFSGKNSCPS